MNESDRYKSATPPTLSEIEDAYPELATPFCVQAEEILENETLPAQSSVHTQRHHNPNKR